MEEFLRCGPLALLPREPSQRHQHGGTGRVRVQPVLRAGATGIQFAHRQAAVQGHEAFVPAGLQGLFDAARRRVLPAQRGGPLRVGGHDRRLHAQGFGQGFPALGQYVRIGRFAQRLCGQADLQRVERGRRQGLLLLQCAQQAIGLTCAGGGRERIGAQCQAARGQGLHVDGIQQGQCFLRLSAIERDLRGRDRVRLDGPLAQCRQMALHGRIVATGLRRAHRGHARDRTDFRVVCGTFEQLFRLLPMPGVQGVQAIDEPCARLLATMAAPCAERQRQQVPGQPGRGRDQQQGKQCARDIGLQVVPCEPEEHLAEIAIRGRHPLRRQHAGQQQHQQHHHGTEHLHSAASCGSVDGVDTGRRTPALRSARSCCSVLPSSVGRTGADVACNVRNCA